MEQSYVQGAGAAISSAPPQVEHQPTIPPTSKTYRKVALSGPPAGMPFIAGSSWNSQALFARRSHRHHPKLRQAGKLAALHDFTGLQETHPTKKRVEVLRLPPRIKAFCWSHGTTHQTGIGLVVKKSFMDKINPIAPEDWNEIVEGRVAALRLRGPDGSLDIFVVYLQSGEDGTVEAATRKLAASTQ